MVMVVMMMPPVPCIPLATLTLRWRRRWAGDGRLCLQWRIQRMSMHCLLLLLEVIMRTGLEEGNEIGLQRSPLLLLYRLTLALAVSTSTLQRRHPFAGFPCLPLPRAELRFQEVNDGLERQERHGADFG